jgi:tRNA(Ile)-lysidine synthase
MANSRKSSSNLPQRVADALTLNVPRGSSILVGLSGGVDSVVLLHLLVQLSTHFSLRLSALHVHHGMSVHANEWADFCVEICGHYAVPLQIECVNLAPLREMGIEAAARQLRHAALADQKVDFIALAHHRDDQAETMLLQLLRGAGVRGASAMPVLLTRPAAPALLRPLLEICRADLLAFANQHSLRWVEDDSNQDERYPRNFLRHRILPVLEQRFPAYRTTLARSSVHFAEAAELLDDLALQDASAAIVGDCLSVAEIKKLSHARSKNLLRYFITLRGAPLPDTTRLTEMVRQLCVAGVGAQICITWQTWQMRCFRDHVYVFPATHAVESFSIVWQGEAELALPASHGKLNFTRVMGQGLSLEKLRQGVVSIRTRQGSESIQLDGLRPRQSLRKLLPQEGMPPWQRELMPLLFSGDELVWVPGVAAAAAYAAQAGEEGVLINWRQQVGTLALDE